MKASMAMRLRARRRQANALGGNKYDGVKDAPTKQQKAEARQFVVTEDARTRDQNRGLTVKSINRQV